MIPGGINMKSLSICLSAILVLFVSVSFADDQGKSPFVAAVSSDGVQKVSIVATEFNFNPGHIVVKVNVPVEITIRKEPSVVPHSFVINSTDAGMEINENLSSDPKVIKFTPTRTGKYAFYCDKKVLFFKSHRDSGMEGVLEVRE
jgi:plastocyanin domain-containing protein